MVEEQVERLYGSRKEIEEYLQSRRRELNQLVDPQTGQEFFKPKIGRPPKNARNQPIFEYLTMKKQKQSTMEATSNKLELAGRARSEELLARKKRARYLEIFNALNPCGSEKVYTEILTTEYLDPEVTRILIPLLQELEETGEKLDFDEFYDSLENLCKFLTPEERHVLLKEKQKVELSVERSKRGTSASVGKMYTRSMKFKEDLEVKMKAERIKRCDNELKECTFHPKIKKYKREKPFLINSWLMAE